MTAAVGVGGVITPAQYAGGGGGGGAVSSVFGRTGAVVATTGDYTAAQVGADQSGAAANAQAAAEAFTTAGFAPLASAALTGTPTAPTASALTDSTVLATTGYADSAVATETSRAETAEALALLKANNLSDVASASTARTNLGLGTAAVLNTPIAASNLSGVVTGTGDASLVLTGTTLETATLDVIASLHPPAASVGMNGQRLTGLATPVNAADAGTLAMARVLGQAGTQMVASGYVGALENFWQCPQSAAPGTGTWTAGNGYLWLMTVMPSATINGYLSFRWANASGMASSYFALYNSSGTKLGATADQSSQANAFLRVSAGFTTTPADGLIYVLYFNGTSGVAGGPYYVNNEWAQKTPALLPGWVAPGAGANDGGSHSSVPSSITLANFVGNTATLPYVAID